MSAQLSMLADGASPWRQVDKFDQVARELADRHYSRRTVGDEQFMPPGRTFVLLVNDERGRAVWGACENNDPAGNRAFRCTIFRNESRHLSSDLIRAATSLTLDRWRRRGWVPHPPLRTEVDPAKVRRKRDPGRCFLRAGWREVGNAGGDHGRPLLIVFEAPGQELAR